MARRNHSRRVHAPYGYSGGAYAEEFGGSQGQGDWRGSEASGGAGGEDQGPWGDVGRIVSDRPHTSLMTAFGVGFGLGLLVTLLMNREEESWYERYAPDSIRDLPDRLRHAGHRLSDSMSSMSGSVKQAGESLASYVPSNWKRW